MESIPTDYHLIVSALSMADSKCNMPYAKKVASGTERASVDDGFSYELTSAQPLANVIYALFYLLGSLNVQIPGSQLGTLWCSPLSPLLTQLSSLLQQLCAQRLSYATIGTGSLGISSTLPQISHHQIISVRLVEGLGPPIISRCSIFLRLRLIIAVP